MPTDLVIETKGEHRGEGAKEHQKGQRKKEIELDVLLLQHSLTPLFSRLSSNILQYHHSPLTLSR